jgi:hypothetical protein
MTAPRYVIVAVSYDAATRRIVMDDGGGELPDVPPGTSIRLERTDDGWVDRGELMDKHNHGHLRYVIGCDQCEVIADENRNQMRLGNCAPMLREASRHGLLAATDGVAFAPFIFAAAADEIERLRAETARLAVSSYETLRAENVELRARIAAAREHIIEAFRWTYDGIDRLESKEPTLVWVDASRRNDE